MKRRQVSQREESEAREKALAHREELLAALQAREVARRQPPEPPAEAVGAEPASDERSPEEEPPEPTAPTT